MSYDSANFVQEFGPTILWSEMQRERYFHSELREIGQKMLRAGHDAEVEIEKFRAKLLEREVATPVSGDGTPGRAREAAREAMAGVLHGRFCECGTPWRTVAEKFPTEAADWYKHADAVLAAVLAAVPAAPDSGPSEEEWERRFAEIEKRASTAHLHREGGPVAPIYPSDAVWLCEQISALRAAPLAAPRPEDVARVRQAIDSQRDVAAKQAWFRIEPALRAVPSVPPKLREER